ncbi:MAG TPA: alpha/beta hydrolase domain-containing protein [Stellaceae bacterium]|nr:alpha/beta hydrolase domain-containing protein [Stellaceae bacterium]HMD66178.1 alpha/beta hydrolase domain-containing protein [Stellaceae bacterium]
MTNRVELSIAERLSFAEGHEFGAVGAYERLVGRAHFAVDPSAPAQRGITDLDKAPTDAEGLVHFTGDFSILKPVDPARGNRRIFFDYGNRGNKRMLQFFNDAPASNDPRTLAHAGNGFLMRRGYTVVWFAWQGDLLPGNGRLLLDLPVGRERGGPLTELVRVEYIADRPGITTFPLSGRVSVRSYSRVSLDPREARLTRRQYPYDERIPVPSGDWCFARVEGGAGLDNQGAVQAVIASDSHIHIPGGFEPGWIYELVYTGRDPLVLGLGHAAVRDFVSFLRYAAEDAAGRVNPLREQGGSIEKAYAWGRSQTGRCLRDFVYRGFNADAGGRKVFDGILPHVAGAGRMWLNHRFANADVSGGQQYEDHLNPADSFPFSYAETTDHLTGRRDAILKRPETDPLVIHTQTATEYWQRRGSLAHTDTRGDDLPQPAGVRIYMWASSQHFADPLPKPPERGVCQNYRNSVATSMLFRAMIDAMDRWATTGVAPPESRIPRRADGTLVAVEEWRRQFPAIPGVATPRAPSALPLLDFGPEAERGILREPPEIVPGSDYTILVPAVDEDGNDRAGVRAPMVAAPLGTYCGWNLRARGFGHGAMHEFSGSYIPLPETPEERRATGDPRRSILERYPDAEAYVRAITAAARQLVEQGLMLEEDVERAAAAAADWGRPRHEIRLR